MRTFFAPDRLEGDGFVVRRYAEGDGGALADATTTSYDHLRPWMEWAVPSQTALEAEVLARGFAADSLKGEDFVMGVWAPDGRRLLGGTGFHPRGKGVFPSLEAEIGMWIRADAAHAGLGTAVLRALLAWAFTAWPWERIEWRCDALNHASRRCAERAGMPLEGVLRGQHDAVSGERRDTCVYAMVRGDHPASTPWQT